MSIEVNDIVYVAKPMACCGDNSDLGVTFLVTGFITAIGKCIYCGHIWPHVVTLAIDHGPTHGFPPEMLRKFDPNSKPVDEHVPEELHA